MHVTRKVLYTAHVQGNDQYIYSVQGVVKCIGNLENNYGEIISVQRV